MTKKEDIKSKNKKNVKIFYNFISHLIIYGLLKIRKSQQYKIL